MEEPVLNWFCLRSQPRRQNVASIHLRSLGFEVFNPHIRLRRATKGGPIWRTEPLFPNYLFARFELLVAYRQVRYAFAVSDILKFGSRWAVLPDGEIATLRTQWGETEAMEVPDTITPGTTVKLTGALFHGMEARVVCLLPARQRLKILIEFLGGVKEAEVDASQVVAVTSHPLAAGERNGHSEMTRRGSRPSPKQAEPPAPGSTE